MKGYVTHNRFVGDHLLYGLGNGWGAQAVAASALHVVPIEPGPATEIKLPHGVDRIEPMSPGAMVIGADGNDLHFSGIRLGAAGSLSARDETVIDDGCKASCVDWYGNARPLFVGDRIFALLGYELVEGSYRDGRMAEVRRSNFAPASRVLAR
ncbi:MAG: hypothetical protein WKF55_00625 [Gemmatimonadaceae bacterium]